MAGERGIAYGFGRCSGVLVSPGDVATAAPTALILGLTNLDLSVIRRLARHVTAVVVEQPMVPYAHEARALWELPVPVLTGISPIGEHLGRRIAVDFESASIGPPAEPVTPSGIEELAGPHAEAEPRPVRINAEVSDIHEASAVAPMVDGWALLKAEDLARMSATERTQLWHIITATGLDAPPVRFFDTNPAAATAPHYTTVAEEPLAIHRRGTRILDSPSSDAAMQTLTALLERAPVAVPIVVLPMVSVPAEVTDFLAMAGQRWRHGVTVETPAAAIRAAEVTAGAHFIEVGTNDLSQYTMAWPRTIRNDTLLPPDTLAAPVADLVHRIVTVARQNTTPCHVGLDLRPSKRLLDQLIGLGVTDISCPAPLVRHWRRLIDTAPRHG
ncbi:putative PEP-binding protein [Micromonospora sp. NPDC049751]|uniref:putative PEP-binding protein n=1 Tax=Micromonospora sp. NPDC049751 TaxID=3154837 RepID=UPI0033E96D7E